MAVIGQASETTSVATIGHSKYGPPVRDGLVAHYDVSELTATDGDRVQTWPDETGNGHNFSQSTESARPEYRENAFPTGLDALDFSTGNMSTGSSSDIEPGSSMTMFIVVEVTGWNDNNPGFWRDGTSSDGSEFMIFQGSTGRPWVRWGGSDILKPGSGYNVPLDEPLVQTWRVKDASWAEFYTDSTLQHSATHGASGAPDIHNIYWQTSKSENIDGLFGEMLFYNRELTDTERADVENYLLDKWITTSISVSVGTVTETTTTNAITSPTSLAIGQVTETNTASTTNAETITQIGQATESSSVSAITHAKAVSTNQAIETDTAQGVDVGEVITVSVGQASETDLAQGVSVTRTVSVGSTTETDTASDIGILKTLTVGQASELATAQAIDALKGTLVGSATETTTVGGVSGIITADQVGAVAEIFASVLDAIGGGTPIDLASDIVATSSIRATMDLDLELADVSGTMAEQIRRQSFVMGDPG